MIIVLTIVSYINIKIEKLTNKFYLIYINVITECTYNMIDDIVVN